MLEEITICLQEDHNLIRQIREMHEELFEIIKKQNVNKYKVENTWNGILIPLDHICISYKTVVVGWATTSFKGFFSLRNLRW